MKKTEIFFLRTVFILLFLAGLAGSTASVCAQPGTGYLYLSDQRIVTLEVVNGSRAVINYLNLSEAYSVFMPFNLIVFGNQGQWKRGQVIKNEDLSDTDNRFFATSLIKPGKVFGVEVMGDLKLEGEVEGACLKIEGRILIFEKLNKRDFEVALARISNIDLDRNNRKSALQRAGFNRGFGRMVFEGTDAAKEYSAYFMEDTVLGPVAIADPKPLLPSAFSHLPDPVVVRVTGFISRFGGLKDTSVIKSLDPVLDEFALETVRGSWQFLPAVQGTEVAEAEVNLNVVFRRE